MLKGDNIYLRPITKADLQCLNRWKNDEDVFMYLGGGFSPVSVDQHEKWLDSLIDMTGKNRRFMICDTQDEPIGMIGLYDINWISRVCEIGVYIGNKDVWGKGYASEACKLLEAFAADHLNVRKLKLSVVADNGTALKMWTSLGYSKIGEHVEERFIQGRYRNLVLMEKFIQD